MGLEECPICKKYISAMAQHLRVSHAVMNTEERGLLLKLVSGRVDVRQGLCPVPGCGQKTTRLDRHIQTHHEMSKAQQREAIYTVKRKFILGKLAELRGSKPEVPMASDLDIIESQHQRHLDDILLGPAAEDAPCPQQEEADLCTNPACQDRATLVDTLHKQISDMMDENFELTSQIHALKRQNRLLHRRLGKRSSLLRRTSTTPMVARAGIQTPPAQGAGTSAATTPCQEGAPEAEPEVASQCLPFPDHVSQINELLEEFARHEEGPDPTPRMRNNVQSKVFRIKNFVAFMSSGQTNLATFTFLDNTQKIREWMSMLGQQKIAPSTIAHYIKNVAMFVKYLKDTPPATCRLKKASLVNIVREIKGITKKQRRAVVLHEISVKEGKEATAIPKTHLLACQEKARVEIPKLLAQLRENRSIKTQRLFYGYMTAYLSALYGHRSGVYQNMKVKEVEQARRDDSEGLYLINVEAHKTNEAFGVAQLLLNAEEYGWMESYMEVRPRLMGGIVSPYFFSTSTSNSCKNLSEYLHEAWARMKLPGKPNFTDFRSSIATYARAALGDDERQKVARFMCHDLSTASKFYALNLTPREAQIQRRIFERVVRAPDAVEAKEPVAEKRRTRKQVPRKRRREEASEEETSEDEGQVPYQESGTSSEESMEEDVEEEVQETTPSKSRPITPKCKAVRVRLSPLKVAATKYSIQSLAKTHERNQRARSRVRKALNKD